MTSRACHVLLALVCLMMAFSIGAVPLLWGAPNPSSWAAGALLATPWALGVLVESAQAYRNAPLEWTQVPRAPY